MINGHIINYAKRRNIELVNSGDSFELFDMNDDCEPLLSYKLDGNYYWLSFCIDRQMKEELAYWIPDQTKLKELISFVASEI